MSISAHFGSLTVTDEQKKGMVPTLEKQFDRKIVLEDGSEYFGYAFGEKAVDAVCELVFNTSMVGYQEILSDPS